MSEGTLTSLLTELRAALGDEPRSARFIRTLHGFGYAFCGEAETVGDASSSTTASRASVWRLVLGNRDLALPLGMTVLGRDPAGPVFIDHPTVSRHHARITVSDSGAPLEDLGSKNGTFLGGQRLSAGHALSDADEIRLGSVTMMVRLVPPPDCTVTAL